MSAWPWPPIQISDCEWIVMRHDRARPKAVVRRFEANPPYYRVVTWAARSEDRKLIGRYRSLEAADEAVLVDSPTQITDATDRDRRAGTPKRAGSERTDPQRR
ncbi:MAG: hypothetical protein JWR04_3128 [Rhodoglobus sp.]|jgi:hypothetical protein|nr:hypothetical protein [Rhodoglobus sp.]